MRGKRTMEQRQQRRLSQRWPAHWLVVGSRQQQPGWSRSLAAVRSLHNQTPSQEQTLCSRSTAEEAARGQSGMPSWVGREVGRVRRAEGGQHMLLSPVQPRFWTNELTHGRNGSLAPVFQQSSDPPVSSKIDNLHTHTQAIEQQRAGVGGGDEQRTPFSTLTDPLSQRVSLCKQGSAAAAWEESSPCSRIKTPDSASAPVLINKGGGGEGPQDTRYRLRPRQRALFDQAAENQSCKKADGDASDAREQDAALAFVSLSPETGSRCIRCLVATCSLLMRVVDSRLTSTLMELQTNDRHRNDGLQTCWLHDDDVILKSRLVSRLMMLPTHLRTTCVFILHAHYNLKPALDWRSCVTLWGAWTTEVQPVTFREGQ